MPQRTPLTPQQITATALHIIDGQGLARLTMRRLGDALDVEAMALYHHLPRGKEQLFDGIVAHLTSVTVPNDEARDATGRLRAWAHAYREQLLTHPGALPLLLTRPSPTLTPAPDDPLHTGLRRAGMTGEAAEALVHTMLSYVLGHVVLEVRGTDTPTRWDDRFDDGLDTVLGSR